MRTEFRDVRDYLTAVGEHTCGARSISVKDEQGRTVATTFVGLACACGEHFVLNLNYVKALKEPLRPFFRTTAQRHESARRMTEEPGVFLLEMRNSGGWDQPDPGVAMMTVMAAMGPSGNPMEERLHAMFKADPKPS